MSIIAEHLTWTRHGRRVIDDVSLHPATGSTMGLLGPNGSGKSSLLTLLQGAARADHGRVLLDGKDLSHQPRRVVARRIAAVTQHADTDAALTVRDVVELGRIPHRGFLASSAAADDTIIDQALTQVGLADRGGDRWHRLSGGERQRAHIARALAQEPAVLLMDEPTNHLDIKHQLELLQLVAGLPVTTVIAIHDLNLAATWCDSVTLLDRGKVVASGTAEEVLTPRLIRDTYGVHATRVPRPDTDRFSFVLDPA